MIPESINGLRKIKVLMVNECSYLSTGYAVYGRNLFTHLSKDPRFDLAEMGTFFNPVDNKANQVPWKFYPNMPSGGTQEDLNRFSQDTRCLMGFALFNSIALDFQPDIVINFNDFWAQSYINQSPYRKCFKSAWMAPHDSIPQNIEWLEDMANHDAVLTYCDWATEEIKRASPKVNVLGAATPCAEPQFFQMNKEDVKLSLGIDPKSKFVGTAMRNQFRKLYPNLFEAFRLFLDKSEREDIYLLVHSSYPDSSWNFPNLIHEYNIAHKTLFTYICHNCGNMAISFYTDFLTCKKCGQIAGKMPTTQKGLSLEDLNRVYNVMDIYVQYANSEGAGMPQIESASCAVPATSVDYSAMSDIVRKLGGWPIKVLGLQTEISTGCKRALPDNDSLVEILLNFFKKPQSIRNLDGIKTKSNVEKYYRWEKTAEVWKRAILETVGEEENRWGIPITEHNPANYEDRPKANGNDVSAPEYVKWLLTNVAGRPDKIGSVLEGRMIRDLNYGMTTEGKSYPYDYRKAYEECRIIGDELKMAESIRKETLGL